MRIYDIRSRKDKRGVDLISDALPFGRLWYREPNAVCNAISYAKHRSRSRFFELTLVLVRLDQVGSLS